MAAKLKIEKRGWVPFKIGTIPARFGLIWFSGCRGKDLNVIFYQNMPNLHNRYKSAEISALLQIKMNSNFNCSYMAMSSLTYILGFSVRYYEIKITSKSFAQKFEPNLHNRYKSAERKISQKNIE
jgi:hypothetical protein